MVEDLVAGRQYRVEQIALSAVPLGAVKVDGGGVHDEDVERGSRRIMMSLRALMVRGNEANKRVRKTLRGAAKMRDAQHRPPAELRTDLNESAYDD